MGWYKVLFCCLYTSVEDMEKILGKRFILGCC